MNIPDEQKYQRFFSVLDWREIILHSIMRRQVKKKEGYNPGKVSIITPTNKTIYQENIFNNFLRQNYQDKELIIVLNNNSLDLDEWNKYGQQLENLQIYKLDESVSQGECLNYAVNHSHGHFIAKFDDDDYYGPNYLVDLIECFSYTDAAVVGKASQFIYFKGLEKLMVFNTTMGYHYYPVWGGTQVIKRQVFERVCFENINLAEDVCFNTKCMELGIKQYVADPFNYLRFRVQNKDFHTYKIDDNEYIKSGLTITGVSNPQDFVTV